MTIISFASILVFSILSLISSSSANERGFSVDLIHRDSPSSPYYNIALTPYVHLANSLRRSNERVDHFVSMFKNKQYLSNDINPDRGEYLMKIALGTPPFTIYAIVDTGGHITWTQCLPCTLCYKQKDPLFDPTRSSTYNPYPCKSKQCISLPNHNCTLNRTCEYSVSYADGSYSMGALASETLTLDSKSGRPMSFTGVTFGCGFINDGTFDENGSGIVGLGGQFPSLITQLNSSIQGKFSYCLGPSSSRSKISSKINFGTDTEVEGSGVVSTPIILKDGYYFLTMEALYVGEQRVNVSNLSTSLNPKYGNILIDSGTTLTYLPLLEYMEFESLVKQFMGNKTVPDPQGFLTLCYKVSDKPLFPSISVQFSGARVDLKPINTFVETSDDVTCLAFSVSSEVIYGNIAQTNFLVGYDTVKKFLSFKPSNCGEA